MTKLIDKHVSLKQCTKAVTALHSHETKKSEAFDKDQLLPGKEQHVWLNVTVKTIPTGHRLKPVKIPIVHPLVDPRTTPVCLITKDPQREYKDLLEKHNIKFISRVVGIEKLKGKFKPFEARRMLLKENGLFLADDRVIPLLPKLLGSKWFDAKKQPMPVCLTRKDLKAELERAISSTYLNQNQGTCTSIKIGKMSQTPSQILDNIRTAIPAIANAVKGNWDNIQSLHIKTNSSASLPIWSCTLDDAEGGRWHGLTAKEDDDEEEGSGSDDEDETEKPMQRSSAAKGRKRPSSSDEEEEVEEKPAKKSKSADGTATAKAKGSPSTSKPSLTDTAPPTSSKKKSKSVEIAKEVVSPSVAPPAAGKKGKSVVIDEQPTAEPTSIAASGSKKQQKKKAAAQSKEGTSSSVPDLAAVNTPPAESAPATKIPSTPSTNISAGKDKAVKEKKISKLPEAASDKTVTKSLTNDEMKQKRASSTIGKKKEIILKAKGGKSAKNAVLGRKVAQE